MKRVVLAAAAVAVFAFGSAEKASAINPQGFPFFPFGFYQPYGAQYGNSMPTPPYFALNPPVYYGARHARPYGMSPFASPPLVAPADNYRGRLGTDFYLPPSETAAPVYHANPCVSYSSKVKPPKGIVRTNPFVSESQVAKK